MSDRRIHIPVDAEDLQHLLAAADRYTREWPYASDTARLKAIIEAHAPEPTPCGESNPFYPALRCTKPAAHSLDPKDRLHTASSDRGPYHWRVGS